MKLKPLGSRVVVEHMEENVDGPIIIPDAAKQKSQYAKIVALGAGKPDFTFTVKVGDTVIAPSYSGAYINREGKEYRIFDESDLLAVLT